MRILILEDNDDRQNMMRKVLKGRFPALRAEFFKESKPMISHIKTTGLDDVAVISLDHDLELKTEQGQTMDGGNGREVVECLVTMPVKRPVIVHTTNVNAGQKMMQTFEDHAWPAARVVPYEDLLWIRQVWAAEMGRQLGLPASKKPPEITL